MSSSSIISSSTRENRSYGGKAGIWLKKCRRSPVFGNCSNNNNNNNEQILVSGQSNSRSVTPLVTEENLLEILTAQATHKQDFNNNESAKTIEGKDNHSPSPVDVKTIIGWDDVLCRPIYKSTTDMNASIAVADRSVTDKDGNDIPVEEQSLKIHATNKTTKKRPRPGYGTRKHTTREDFNEAVDFNSNNDLREDKITDTNDDDHDDDNARHEEPNKVPTNVNNNDDATDSKDFDKATITTSDETSRQGTQVMSAHMTSPNDANFDLSSPHPVRLSSICHALNSEAKGTPAIPRVTDFNGDDSMMKKLQPSQQTLNLEPVSEEPNTTIPKGASSLLLKPKGKNKTDANSATTTKAIHDQNGAIQNNDDDGATDNTSREEEKNIHLIRQPSSHTSMDIAKAFFEHLDSTQILVLDSSSNGTPLQRSGTRYCCVRTLRKTDMCSTPLKEEYNTYVEATKENGVTPLSIQEYAVNRGNYFRKSQVYEGFLDE